MKLKKAAVLEPKDARWKEISSGLKRAGLTVTRARTLDELTKEQVVVLGPKGEVSEVIGRGHLVLPMALAVDHAGRVFVADEVDQRILVFRGPRLIGRSGTFGRIESLALDGDRLYVADSLLGRVQVVLVAPA